MVLIIAEESRVRGKTAAGALYQAWIQKTFLSFCCLLLKYKGLVSCHQVHFTFTFTEVIVMI